MPSIDEKTGKRTTGAQDAKKAKLRDQEEAVTEKRRRAKTVTPNLPSGTADFDRLPPVPIGDPTAAVAWLNDALLICAQQIIRDPFITSEKRWRFLLDAAAKAGMIRDKALTQTQLQQLKKKREDKQEVAQLDSIVSISKPATARPPR